MTPDLPLNAGGTVAGAPGINGQSGPPYDVTEQGSCGATEWDDNEKASSYITGGQPTSVGGYGTVTMGSP